MPEHAVLKFVIEAMVDALLVVDVEGRITLANTAAERLTGYPRDELTTIRIDRLLVDESSGLRTMTRRRIAGGAVLRREESWIVAKDGSRVPVSVTAAAIHDANEQLGGIVLVARDVRELRQLIADKEAEIARRRAAEENLRAANASIEARLEETRSQLALAERRATLGTLAGGVGHELRNIAQIQVAAVEELAASLNEPDARVAEVARDRVADLERVGEHIAAHGDRLLRLARPGPDRVGPIDLRVVVRDVIELLRGAGKLRRVAIDLALGDEPLTVTVNRTRIEQIYVNLVINAVDAIGEEAGTIALRVGSSADGRRALCEVRDTGPGIPPDRLDEIFVPFYSTKTDRGGTGLGLPVAREIVESYGGSLRVTSELGKGTAFTFELPR
jgi:PAS domain S-box-containing protein